MMEVQPVGVSLIQAAIAGLDEKQVEGLLLDLAASARNHWIKLAGALGASVRVDYIAGIQEVDFQPGVATIALVGMMPNLIEQGMDTVDMHDTLLGPNVPVVPMGGRGKHAKTDGSGFYRAIPFRHSTPTSNGSTGQPMGSQFAGDPLVNAAKLGKDVYNAAKKLDPSTSDPYSGTKWGGRLPGGMAPKLKPHHHSDIFSGMVKMQKTYKNATQNQYMTFRTISTGSPGWIRPATPGVHLATQVSEFVGHLVPQVLDAYFGAQGGTP